VIPALADCGACSGAGVLLIHTPVRFPAPIGGRVPFVNPAFRVVEGVLEEGRPCDVCDGSGVIEVELDELDEPAAERAA
jgi:hypothetical protein